MARTKKVKSTGRFLARYGRKIRIRVRDIESLSKKKYVCPKCGAIKVKRVSSGIWACKKCGYKFTGAAYLPFPKVASPKRVQKLPNAMGEISEESVKDNSSLKEVVNNGV